jgi:zinc/manganese transport system substrate-binding protein
VHAGNPHLHLDPHNVARVAKALAQRMGVVDAQNASFYIERDLAFQARWREATARWEREGERLKDVPVVVHHRDLSYLIAWLGMREVGALEPKPGLPPSTAHLAALLAQLQRAPARMIVRSAYSDPRPARWLAQQAKVPAVLLPFTVGGTEQAQDLFGLYEDTIQRLLAGAK